MSLNKEELCNTVEVNDVKLPFNDKSFVDFSDIAIKLLNQQAQYASRYADDIDNDYPNFGKCLRINGDSTCYHDMQIHKDDVKKFVGDVLKYKKG